MSVVAIVERGWRSLGDPPPGLVVAVSGGPDSVALFRAVVAVRPDPAIPLVLAHLNHQLRGTESDDDERFVRHLAASVPGVTLACDRLAVGPIAAAERGNLEAVARRERYRWLAGVARAHGLRFVTTGHTANDQAETVLHRLLRGTGLDGLRGIAFRRPLDDGVEAVRPLLPLTRAEVLDYLARLNQPARHDASNDDRRHLRNRIRHELLPLLARDYNPGIVAALGRLATQAAEAAAAETEAADALLHQAERPRAGPLVILDAATLAAAPRRLVRAAIRQVWQREGWPLGEMGFTEYERVAALATAARGAHDLPGGVRARRRGAVMQLGPASPPSEPRP